MDRNRWSDTKPVKETYTVFYARRSSWGMELAVAAAETDVVGMEVARAGYMQVASYESVGAETRIKMDLQDDFFGTSLLREYHPEVHARLKQMIAAGETDHMSFGPGDVVLNPLGEYMLQLPIIGWRRVFFVGGET